LKKLIWAKCKYILKTPSSVCVTSFSSFFFVYPAFLNLFLEWVATKLSDNSSNTTINKEHVCLRQLFESSKLTKLSILCRFMRYNFYRRFVKSNFANDIYSIFKKTVILNWCLTFKFKFLQAFWTISHGGFQWNACVPGKTGWETQD